MAKGLLIDLSGVVYSGDSLLPGSAEAIGRLQAAELPFRFLTNTTSKPKYAVRRQLQRFGLSVDPDDILTPAEAAVAWLRQSGRAPHLLVHPDLEEDFAGCAREGPPAVVVGDAGRHFTYERLNAAFRLLIAGAPFVALATNRLFRDADGELSMDAGAFVKALEFASEIEPVVMGKPAPAFFAAAAESMAIALQDITMIGDDVESDVTGALAAGVGAAVLVRTGKYRQGDEEKPSPRPFTVADTLAEAIGSYITG